MIRKRLKRCHNDDVHIYKWGTAIKGNDHPASRSSFEANPDLALPRRSALARGRCGLSLRSLDKNRRAFGYTISAHSAQSVADCECTYIFCILLLPLLVNPFVSVKANNTHNSHRERGTVQGKKIIREEADGDALRGLINTASSLQLKPYIVPPGRFISTVFIPPIRWAPLTSSRTFRLILIRINDCIRHDRKI